MNTFIPMPIFMDGGSGECDGKVLLAIYIVLTFLSLIGIIVGIIKYFHRRDYYDNVFEYLFDDDDIFVFISSATFALMQIAMIIALLVTFVMSII